MGSGSSGGSFGNTQGAEVSLPKNNSQLKHIFRDDEGHLLDTPENRKLLYDLANDKSKFVGKDKWGNAEILEDGSQNWVRYRNGVINEGGKNLVPHDWDSQTGFNFNPQRSMYNIFMNPFLKEVKI